MACRCYGYNAQPSQTVWARQSIPLNEPNPSRHPRIPVEGFPNHFLFYRVDAATHTVTVVRMLHGARDFESML